MPIFFFFWKSGCNSIYFGITDPLHRVRPWPCILPLLTDQGNICMPNEVNCRHKFE